MFQNFQDFSLKSLKRLQQTLLQSVNNIDRNVRFRQFVNRFNSTFQVFFSKLSCIDVVLFEEIIDDLTVDFCFCWCIY